ncbi:MAG: insulinase family protein [Planctomycetes bacterium]|nr:insulinase family protein [Planctomycetota bacterium]
MRTIFLSATFLLILGLTSSAKAQDLQIDVKEHVLGNGMKILVVERDTEPTATCWLFYRVGSVDEHPGITGISHLLEHMMFKGTHTMGVKDAELDEAIMTQQDALWIERKRLRGLVDANFLAEYDEVSQTVNGLIRRLEEGREALETRTYNGMPIPEQFIPEVERQIAEGEAELAAQQQRLAELESREEYEAMGAVDLLDGRWEELNQQSRDNVIKDELWDTYLNNGATGLNAFTAEDTTAYIVTLPANKVELFMWLESDRLADPVYREFYEEREVVKEERRLMENRPLGFYNEAFNEMFFQASPYSWPVLGWMTDLNAIKRQDLYDYVGTYYKPNNAVAVIVGRVDADDVFGLAERYFGPIPRGPSVPQVITTEPEQNWEKRIYYSKDVNSRVDISYHAPGVRDSDMPAMQLLGDILSGDSGRLHKELVEDKQVALSASAGMDWPGRFARSFDVRVTCAEGHSPEELLGLADGLLQEVAENGVTAQELQRVKNQAFAENIRGLRSNEGLVQQLGFLDIIYEWQQINRLPRLLQNVTVEDVRRVAQTYLKDTNRTVGLVTRAAGSGEGSEGEGAERFDGSWYYHGSARYHWPWDVPQYRLTSTFGLRENPAYRRMIADAEDF